MSKIALSCSVLVVAAFSLLWSPHEVSEGKAALQGSSVNRIEFEAIEDVYVLSGQPDASFGKPGWLWVGYNNYETIKTSRIFVKFDPQSIADQVRNGTAMITSVSLQLYLGESAGDAGVMNIQANRTLSAWTESVTWNLHLSVAVDETRPVSTGVSASKGVYSWDVSSQFQDWVNTSGSASPLGFRLTGSEGPVNSLRGFWSRNCADSECSGQRPRLIVNYVTVTPTPTPTSTPTPTPTPGPSSFFLSSSPTNALSPGDIVTYTIDLLNGSHPLSGIVVTNTAPSELVVLSDTVRGGALGWQSTIQGQQITWTLNQTLTPNAADQLSYQAARPTPTPTITPTPFVMPTSLGIVKFGPESVALGALITYTLRVDNQTPYTLTAVTITDAIPHGLEIIDAGGGAITSTAGLQILWQEPAPFGSGETLTKTFSGRAATGVAEVVNQDYQVYALTPILDAEAPITAAGTISVTTRVIEPLPLTPEPVIINAGACIHWEYAVSGQPFQSGVQCSGPTFNPSELQWLPFIAQ